MVSGLQRECLLTLGRRMLTTSGVAAEIDVSPPVAGKVLAALYRRSLVTITETGKWCTTERGRRKVAL